MAVAAFVRMVFDGTSFAAITTAVGRRPVITYHFVTTVTVVLQPRDDHEGAFFCTPSRATFDSQRRAGLGDKVNTTPSQRICESHHLSRFDTDEYEKVRGVKRKRHGVLNEFESASATACTVGCDRSADRDMRKPCGKLLVWQLRLLVQQFVVQKTPRPGGRPKQRQGVNSPCWGHILAFLAALGGIGYITVDKSHMNTKVFMRLKHDRHTRHDVSLHVVGR